MLALNPCRDDLRILHPDAFNHGMCIRPVGKSHNGSINFESVSIPSDGFERAIVLCSRAAFLGSEQSARLNNAQTMAFLRGYDFLLKCTLSVHS